MPLSPGDRLGAYEIVALLGAGGMGEVYRARDPRLARDVAIKVLLPDVARNPDRLRRFEQEARAAAALNHPNILAVHDVAIDPTGADQGSSYVVAELLEGEPLDKRLQSGVLPMRKAIDYALQLSRGLAAAHERGVVHRDLKPANLFITTDGRLKILDFGVAKLTEREGSAPGTMLPTVAPATTPGVVLGTIGYMSPEQVRGLPADHRSDLFSFGVILYEMLSGRRAFAAGTEADTMTAILKEDPPDLPAAERHIPPPLVRIVDRCLEKQPASRFQSAGDLGFAIEALSSQSGVTSTIADATSPAQAASSRKAWTIAAVLGVMLAAALAWLATLYLRAPIAPATVRFNVPPPEGWAFTSGNLRLAISPDARRLAFVARSTEGKSMLWVRAVDSVSAQLLNGTENASNPFWSPDSRFVGFYADGKLKKIDVTGGPPIALCDTTGNVGASWSREGVIVFGAGAALQRVQASGGTPTPASILRPDEGSHSGPSFLPDGRHFIYSASISGSSRERWDNYIGSLDSADAVRIEGAHWSKAVYSNGHMLFPRETTLMAQPFDVGRFTTTGEAFPIVERVQLLATFGVALVSVSENGAMVYQTGTELGTAELVWVDRAGKRLGRVGDPAAFADLHLSPDAKRAMVSITDATQPTRDLWVVDLERGLRTRFTFHDSDELWSVWSPDGARIAFNSQRSGRMDLYVKSSSGAGADELLLADENAKTPTSWSPDGQHLLFSTTGTSSTNKVPDLWVLPLTGERKPFPFTQTRFAEGVGEFAPDGKFIVYTSDESGRFEIYVAPFPGGGGKWQVSTQGGTQPHWRADGQEIFYMSGGQIMAARVTTRGEAIELGAVTRLFPIAPGGARAFYGVAPDGQRFLVNAPVEATAVSPITVVLNWLEGINR